MTLSVKVCGKSESDTMVAIFTEMEEHYFGEGVIEKQKMQDYLALRVFAENSGMTIIRADLDNKVIGFACISVLYPSPRYSGQMFIKELYISESNRGQGVGKKLMQFIAQLAIDRDCNSLDWMSEKNNLESKGFYTALGGKILDGMYHFRLAGGSLEQLADRRDL